MMGAHRFDFAERLLVINNVEDRGHATSLADEAVRHGEIDRFVFVANELDAALARCGLRQRDLGQLWYYSAFAFVELCTARTDYILHQDAEVDLVEGFDWVSPAVEQMDTHPEVLVVNPCWTPATDTVLAESYMQHGSYAVGQGFSDQLFLTRRNILAAPIYNHRHWASLRYPMATFGPIFEAWVDSYMRSRHLLRLTDLRVTYQHRSQEGASHLQLVSRGQVLKQRLFHRLSRIGMRHSSREGQRSAQRYVANS